ncbi:MerR family DNA-binding protein [Halobacteriovorax sp. DA5]|uniref:MerR family DNA-binding protein n=1 Tax=Halobacteriovorax sp. DA5 TaxID=2067553 RepID=UPI000CD2C7EC|nr:MerR family DNA-binding protein [Halobacteriovorax sp. DA5]POB13572.1 MerR family transcriptional regulator [Halobacteriovorax sp. DA5]
MDISELSKVKSLASSKIRYYEKIGLIKSIGRHGLKRVFPKGVIHNLSFISLAQSCGLSLEEISSMLTANGKFKVRRSLFTKKINEIDEQIEKLKKMKNSLEHLNNCKEKDHFECANFQKLLKDAL